MKRWFVGVTLLAALALPASSARADGWNFDSYCIMGSFQVCASVRVFTQAGGNELVMQVWNLEGSLGVAHTITSIGLYHLGSVPTKIALKSAYYGATDVTGSWSAQGGNDIKTLGGIDLQIRTGTGGNSGINGCTTLPGGTKWNTCNSFPAAPYVQFTFEVGLGGTGSYAVGSAPELRWHSQQIGPNEISLKCDTGGAGDYPDCNVVPEPISMVLLGTGLAGLGALRRRRKGLDIENA